MHDSPTVTRAGFLRAAAAAPAALAACSGGVKHARHVRIAYVPVLAAAPIMVAADRGYLAEAGIEAELVTIATAQDAIALLARGRLDAAIGGLSAAFFNAVHRGFNVKVAGNITYIPTRGHPTALLVRTDLYEGGLRDARDLRGQRVGVIGGLGTSSSYYLGVMMQPLTFSDIDVVPLNGGDQGVALARKSIAAAFAWNPFTQAFERKGLAKIAGLPKGDSSTSGLLFGERLVADAGLGRAVFGAVDRAVREISGPGYYDPKNLAAFAHHIRQPAEALAKEDRYTYKPGMPIDRATLDSMQRLFIAEKTLAYRDPVPDERLIVETSPA